MSVTAAQGFVASGVGAGIRRSALDLALVRSLPAAVGGAVWTTNRVQAAPVTVSRRHLETAEPQAVVVNSGVANAATGDARNRRRGGRRRPRRPPRSAFAPRRSSCSRPASSAFRFRWRSCAAACASRGQVAERGRSERRGEAILTTDRGPKQSSVAGAGFTVGGMAKGAGMIHPRLATMLAVVTTDFPLEPGEPAPLLRTAVDATFNRISVDGECSTNDAVVLLANGASGVREIRRPTRRSQTRSTTSAPISRGRSSRTARARRCCSRSRVSGAASDEEAIAVARRIATSPLVKTAAFGRDPNWGRVLAAAGSAPWNGGFARLDPELLTVAFDGTRVFERGAPTGFTPELTGAAVSIDLELGLGTGSAAYLASDLTYDYVRLNAEYTT